jgi:hypothetical protein
MVGQLGLGDDRRGPTGEATCSDTRPAQFLIHPCLLLFLPATVHLAALPRSQGIAQQITPDGRLDILAQAIQRVGCFQPGNVLCEPQPAL